MSSEHAFLRTILDSPDDDAPRLVFADWLDDRGDPRGELIRVQCQLAAWEPDLERRTALQRRERTLIATHSDEWLGPLRRDCTLVEFRRGLAQVTIPVNRFLRRRSAQRTRDLFDRAFVETVRLIGKPEEFQRLPDAPALEAVVSLDLSGSELDDTLIFTLSASPHLGRLTRLDLSNNGLTTAQPLLEGPLGERLIQLDLRNNRLCMMKHLALHGGNSFPRCQFDLRGNHLRDDANFRCSVSRKGTAARPINSLGMEFVRIPAGTFLMGSPTTEANRHKDEGPQRAITLSRPFFLGVYPVTQWEYGAVMGENPSGFTSVLGGGPACPVENVTWFEAVAFCRRLSDRREEVAAGRSYRLPTEAEWEHACRAGTTTAFHYGTGLSSAEANFQGGMPYFARAGGYIGRTTAVGSYRPNAFGLFDMHGNVWEWCADWFDERYLREVSATDPAGPNEGIAKTQRGGCWSAYGQACRSAYRSSKDPPDRRTSCIGFRVVLEV